MYVVFLQVSTFAGRICCFSTEVILRKGLLSIANDSFLPERKEQTVVGTGSTAQVTDSVVISNSVLHKHIIQIVSYRMYCILILRRQC